MLRYEGIFVFSNIVDVKQKKHERRRDNNRIGKKERLKTEPWDGLSRAKGIERKRNDIFWQRKEIFPDKKRRAGVKISMCCFLRNILRHERDVQLL